MGREMTSPKKPARTEAEKAITELPQYQDQRQMCPDNCENPKTND